MQIDYLNDHNWWSRVDVCEPAACWLWLLSCGSHGYGQTWDGTTVLLAHRVAWTLANGEIPGDLTIDHICRNRRCCNPSHLRLMTNVENASANGMSTRTHCPRDHPYNDENTYIDPGGGRRCRQCHRENRTDSVARRCQQSRCYKLARFASAASDQRFCATHASEICEYVPLRPIEAYSKKGP